MDINPQEQKPDIPGPKKKSSLKTLVLVLCIVLVVSASGAWFLLRSNRQRHLQPVPTTVQQSKPGAAGEEQRTTGAATHKKKEQPEPDAANEPATQPVTLTPQQQCKQLATRLNGFFHHLDGEPYIKEFNLNQPSQDYFDALSAKVLANPPTVTRESDDLYTILTNMAHFFRIIGKQNILLMKGILDRERDKIEDVAADLYKWILSNKCSAEDSFKMKASLDKLYEYAGFFLNTMGGRSYLFRRDSRSRLLVNYYSILIIDRANRENLNLYGLDIAPMIPQLIGEIEATNQLIYKEDYIDTLTALEEKYPLR